MNNQSWRQTPLHFAVGGGHKEVSELLLLYAIGPADINAAAANDHTRVI
jgi:ankyrin repeat protein